MDSSYGNGGQNIPGAKPGVIASGPDAPDIPGVTLESENPNGVLSKISRKPSNSGSVVVDGGGGPKRSNRKGLVFVGVALIGIALIAGIVAVVLMGSNKDNGNSYNDSQPVSDNNNTEIAESNYKYSDENREFYRYANYILYGDKSVSRELDLGIYNENTEYSIYKAASEDDVDFLRQSVVFWKSFYTKMTTDIKEYNLSKEVSNSGSGSSLDVNASNTVEDSEDKIATLEKHIELQNKFMDFVEKYAAMNARTEEGMWKLYSEVGLDAAVKTVKADYELLSQTIYELGAKWATAKTTQAEAALNLYAKYDSLGCIKDNDYDQSCIDKNLGALSDTMKKYVTARTAVEATGTSLDDVFVGLVKNCFEIRDLLGTIEKESDVKNSSDSSDGNTNNNSTGNESASDRSIDNA